MDAAAIVTDAAGGPGGRVVDVGGIAVVVVTGGAIVVVTVGAAVVVVVDSGNGAVDVVTVGGSVRRLRTLNDACSGSRSSATATPPARAADAISATARRAGLVVFGGDGSNTISCLGR